MKSYKHETFKSQLKELWKSCSKVWICIVAFLSGLTAFVISILRINIKYGIELEQLWNHWTWESCIVQFFILSLFIWLILFNKKVFSPQNVNSRGAKFKLVFDRIISQGHSIQFYWLVSCFVLLLTFLSALMGTLDAFADFTAGNSLNWNPLSLTYLLLTDTSTISSILQNNNHIANAIVIFCILISVTGTLLFTGLLVSVFSNFLQRRVEDFQKGRLHYNLSDHIVFIGYDSILPQLVKQCAEYEANKNKKIIVQTKLPSEQVREDIRTLMTDNGSFRNIIFYNGRRDSIKDLRTLDLESASEIFIIGNRHSDNHDELNLQCLNYVCDIINECSEIKKHDKKTQIHLLIEDHTEYSKMKFIWEKEERFSVILFNLYAIWAKTLLHGNSEYPQIDTPPTEQQAINIVIFGMSKYGSSIGIEAINTFKHKKSKTIVTFICNEAQSEMDMLRARFPELFCEIKSSFNNMIDSPTIYESRKSEKEKETLNIEIEFIETNPFNSKLYAYLGGRKLKKYVFLCTDKNTLDLNCALFMPHEVLLKSQVYILQKHGNQFVSKLDYLPSVFTFGSLNPAFNFYKQLLDKSDDLSDKYDSYKETSIIYENQGNWNRALDYGLELLELSKSLYGTESDKYANDLLSVGFLYERIDDYETASYFIQDAYKIKEKIYGYFSKEIADLENALGWCYVYQSDFSHGDFAYYGQECFGRAIEIQETIWGKEPQNIEELQELADSYNGLYYAAQSTQRTAWKPYYDKYIALSKIIETKKSLDSQTDVRNS